MTNSTKTIAADQQKAWDEIFVECGMWDKVSADYVVDTLIKKIGEKNVKNAVSWFANSMGAGTLAEAKQIFVNVVNDFESMIEFKSATKNYIVPDMTSPIDKACALFNSDAIANYIEQKLA